jgi:YVTN family beta-propeller protein
MKLSKFLKLIAVLAFALSFDAAEAASVKPASGQTYLSPTALAASSDGTTLFIACATANKVIAFDVASGKIKNTVVVSALPLGLALSPDGKKLYVTCAAPQSSIAVIDTAKFKVVDNISAGHTAMAPVVSPDGKTLYVCNRFNNAVTVFDLKKGKQIAQIAVPREPIAAAITPDGKLLFAANHIHAGRSDGDFVSSSVSVIDTAARKVLKEIVLPNGSTLLRGVAISPDGKYAAVTHILARFHLPTTQIERGWINNNALSIIDVEKRELLNTVLLDNIDSGAGNAWAVEWTRDGKSICVTHAGTHELSVIDAPALLQKLASVPKAPAQMAGYQSSASRTTADVPNDLAFLVGLRKRIKLGDEKAPRGLALIGNKAFTANYFSDSLSVVDLSSQAAPTKIALGPKYELSAVRQGELNWNDASVCFQGWQSCSSCHSSDARVDGMNWDNLNDGIGNPKNAKSMVLAHKTPPSMALGVRANAEVSVRAGIKNSLFVVLPDEFANALDEYLKSLTPMPSPHLVKGKLSKSAERGKKLFTSEKVGCADCHQPGLFTDMKFHNVGTIGKFDNPTNRFDTPTLAEVWRSGPYLHDGSAATIRDVVTTRNSNDRHGNVSQLTQKEIDDLVAYVLSL